jgi:urease accessory protein UreH
MGRGSRGIFGDALAAGRIAHGERWNFHEVDSHIEIALVFVYTIKLTLDRV